MDLEKKKKYQEQYRQRNKEYFKKYREKHKQERLEYQKEYIQRPEVKDKLKEYQKNYKQKTEYHKKYYLNNKDKWLIKNYGINDKQRITILEKQNFKCAICYNEISSNNCYIDHQKETKNVRGLLCIKCNTGLGKFNDDIQLMEKALNYLKENNIAQLF